MKVIYFQPEDYLIFRDNRNFGFSDNSNSTLPNIIPFYGALRTALMMNGIKSSEIIGNTDSPGKIKLTGPFIFKKEIDGIKHYFPTPEHLIVHEDEESKERKFSKLKPHKYLKHNYKEGLELSVLWDEDFVQGKRAVEDFSLIELKELEKLQSGGNFELTASENFYKNEHRLGIGLKPDQKNAEEQLIYRINYFRFTQNSGFFAFVENGDEYLKNMDYVYLGGKKQLAKIWISELNTNIFNSIDDNTKAITLLTPAIFNCGMTPNNDTNFFGARLKAICNSKPVSISGWDLEKQKPKPMYHALKPGTTFFVEGKIEDGNISDHMKEFNFGKYIELKI